jgi:hypothetical protein
MARTSTLGVLIAAAAALLTACGTEVSEGGAGPGSGSGSGSGSGGSGAGGASGTTGGSQGAGGGAGGSADTCSPETKAAATSNGPSVGFEDGASGPGTAAVHAIDPTGIDLSVGPDAPPLRFRWVGPDLSASFTDGEIVSIGVSDGWHFVAGEKATAAAIRHGGFTAPKLLPEIPGGGPALGFSEQCYFYEAVSDCEGPPSQFYVLALDAALNGAAATIPQGATAPLEAWQIHNALAWQFPGSGNGCVVEGAYKTVITALGPAAPP